MPNQILEDHRSKIENYKKRSLTKAPSVEQHILTLSFILLTKLAPKCHWASNLSAFYHWVGCNTIPIRWVDYNTIPMQITKMVLLTPEFIQKHVFNWNWVSICFCGQEWDSSNQTNNLKANNLTSRFYKPNFSDLSV